MKFDYTHGRKANFIVSVYGDTVEDKYYLHYYGEAKTLFDQIKRGPHAEGTIISIRSKYGILLERMEV